MSLDAMKQALRAAEFADLCIKELVTGSTNREVAKQVLSEAITFLRAAIEQAQGKHEDWCASLTQLLLSMPPKPAPCNCKPRTAPPRQWQGLTDAERGITAAETWGSVLIAPQSYQAFARAIEAKLKTKNA